MGTSAGGAARNWIRKRPGGGPGLRLKRWLKTAKNIEPHDNGGLAGWEIFESGKSELTNGVEGLSWGDKTSRFSRLTGWYVCSEVEFSQEP